MSKLGFIFNSIKEFRLFRNIYYRIKYRNIYYSNVSDEEYLTSLGILKLHYKMNLKNPTTFNEKINWYKLNYCNDLMKIVVDKDRVKTYLKEKGLDNILINTIKVYDKIEDLRLEDLPNKFVVKNTMDSGGVFICRNKEEITYEDISKKLKNIINFKNGKHIGREFAYNEDNNKIIVEELIETPDGTVPKDYKFFCFNGEPRFLYVTSNKDIKTCLDFYDMDFNHLKCHHVYPNSKEKIDCPLNFDLMKSICKELSKDFPHVRVDLYNVNGKIYFGELTFYTSGGLHRFKPQKWDKIFGDMWDLSKINNYR